MPDHDPRAIANEFIRHNGGRMDQMRLQKLVYMAQGWNLAINEQPLVDADFEAWDGGPVARRIWNHIRDFGFSRRNDLLERAPGEPYQADLLPAEREVIEQVWRKYRKFSGRQLSDMTHEPGTPWSNTYFGRGRNAPLPHTEISRHFRELALAGRSRAAAAV